MSLQFANGLGTRLVCNWPSTPADCSCFGYTTDFFKITSVKVKVMPFHLSCFVYTSIILDCCRPT